MARILLAEDDIDTNEAVSAYLTDVGHRVVPAFDGREALAIFAAEKVDVLILDIMLPVVGGLSVLRAVRETSRIPALMLTALGDEGTEVACFDGLADDFMPKPFSLTVLEKRVDALLRRTIVPEDPALWTHGDVVVDFRGYCARNADGELDVTPKEIDLLRMLVENRGRVLTRGQILDGVWGPDAEVLDRLVDTYVKNLRKKLGLDCIRTVKGVGYKLEAGERGV